MKIVVNLSICIVIMVVFATGCCAKDGISTRGGIVRFISEDNSESVIFLNDKEIYRNKDYTKISNEKNFVFKTSDVLLFRLHSDGNMSPTSFVFVTINPDTTCTISKEVGNGGDSNMTITSNGDNIILMTQPSTSTTNYTILYDNRAIKESEVRKKNKDIVDNKVKTIFYDAYAEQCEQHFTLDEVVNYACYACRGNINYFKNDPSLNVIEFNKLCRKVSKTGKVVDRKAFDRVVFRK